MHLSKFVYYTVQSCKTVNELWKTLSNTYEKKVVATKIFLIRRLYNLRMRESDSIVAHGLNEYRKQVATSHPTSVPRELSPLDLVRSDICGPMPHQSLGGASYFVTFIDNATIKVWAYSTRTKDRVFMIFKEWLAMVKNQTDRKLKSLRSDNGGEYKSNEFVQFYQEHGIR
jgi:hypothetical protein